MCGQVCFPKPFLYQTPSTSHASNMAEKKISFEFGFLQLLVILNTFLRQHFEAGLELPQAGVPGVCHHI